MANINLYQNEQTEYQRERGGILNNGMFVALAFALLTFLAYGGVEFYLRSINQKIEFLVQEEKNSRQALQEKDVNAAASFQQRMETISLNVDSFAKKDPAGIFESVQKTVIDGVVVSSLDFDGKEIGLSLVADNFETLSKQILNFKKSDFFEAVNVGSTSLGEEEKVSAAFTLAVAQ